MKTRYIVVSLVILIFCLFGPITSIATVTFDDNVVNEKADSLYQSKLDENLVPIFEKSIKNSKKNYQM